MKHQRSSILYIAFILLGGLLGTEAARYTQKTFDVARYVNASLLEKGDPVDHLRRNHPKVDYNKETKIYWSEKSPMPLSVEGLIAMTWITMVACFPLMAFDGEVTKVQITLAVAMWLVLITGLHLFHNELLFQSSHFDHVRSLTMVECVYFMSQVLTTVGYGDITPATYRGQTFVGLFVIFCLMVVMNFVSEVAALLNRAADRLHDKLEMAVQHERVPRTIRRSITRIPKNAQCPSLDIWLPHGKPPIPYREFAKGFWMYFFVCLIGILFYTNYPGENKTLLEGIYMSVITLSTVGFGAVTPLTEGGKVFGAFWMLFGSTALVRLIGSFSQLMNALKCHERWEPSKAYEHDHRLLTDLPEEISRLHFLKFGLLHSGYTKQEDLDRMEDVFNKLEPDGDGTISKEAVLAFFAPPQKKKSLGKVEEEEEEKHGKKE